jgi:sugar phosphate isomerase/epimerase
VIALENMPFKKLILSTPGQVLDFVKEFDSPFFRICLDTGHAAVFGLSPAEAVRQIGRDYLACLHVHDNDGVHDRHWEPYRGVVEWADFSSALHEIGFKGALSLETNVSKKLPASIRPEWEKALAATARHLALCSD